MSQSQRKAVTTSKNNDEDESDVRCAEISELQTLVPSKRFNILGESEKFNEMFKVRIRKLRIQIVPDYDTMGRMKWLKAVFRDIHTYATFDCCETDYIRISFNKENSNLDVQSSPFRPVSKLHYRDLWELISESTKYPVQFDLAEPFMLIVEYVKSLSEDTICRNLAFEEENKQEYQQESFDQCLRCLKKPACDRTSVDLECLKCRRVFWGEICLKRHREIGSFNPRRTVCEMFRHCLKCAQLVDGSTGEEHSCDIRFCETCNCKRPFKHLCFMGHRKIIDKSTNYFFIFHDFEPQQKEEIPGTTSADLPKICVAHQVCTKCLSGQEIPMSCKFCGPNRVKIFKENPVKELVDFATRDVEEDWHIICIAYNVKDSNTRLILPYLSERSVEPPRVTYHRNIIVRRKTSYTRFLDAQRYMSMLELSALSKAVELWENEFSGLFNTHQRIVDAALATGCWLRVDILRRACITFRKMFLECGKICPFVNGTTLAAACSEVFRKNYLQPDTIPILPPNGYKYEGRYSQKAIKWLDWKEHELGVEFKRVHNSREFIIPEMGRSVDGFYEADGKSYVFEFHHCYWHGCQCECFLVDKKKMDERAQETRFKTARMKEFGYVVEEIWECEFDRLLKEKEKMRRFFEQHSSIQTTANSKPLVPREAIYSARVEYITRYYKVPAKTEDGARKEIRYTDVCSLHPYIYKYGWFPVGHPKVYTGDECREVTGESGKDISGVEGLVKCWVLPPQNLYHPVLPVCVYGEQIFPLCRSCYETLEEKDCPHVNESARQFEGTWVSDELKKAVEKGYEIVKVLEIWQYSQITQYDKSTGKGGLFVDYTDTFFKIKQEASGWPSHIPKEKYLDWNKQIENIQLDSAKVTNNPGLRLLAKRCLNVFWGKLGQRENIPKTRFVKTRRELLKLLSNPEIMVTELLPVNDQLFYATWSSNKGRVVPLPTANAVITAYITAQARLELYKYLEKLDRRVLYYDTDAVMYVQTTNLPTDELKTGCLLGEMTDQIANTDYESGSYIKEYVAIGPKSYAYIVRRPNGDETEVCKVKGITLNHTQGSKINFESMRKMVMDHTAPIQLNYLVNPETTLQAVSRRNENENSELIFNRRRLTDNFDTLPYGYRRS